MELQHGLVSAMTCDPSGKLLLFISDAAHRDIYLPFFLAFLKKYKKSVRGV